jgi:hypothetical protein
LWTNSYWNNEKISEICIFEYYWCWWWCLVCKKKVTAITLKSIPLAWISSRKVLLNMIEFRILNTVYMCNNIYKCIYGRRIKEWWMRVFVYHISPGLLWTSWDLLSFHLKSNMAAHLHHLQHPYIRRSLRRWGFMSCSWVAGGGSLFFFNKLRTYLAFLIFCDILSFQAFGSAILKGIMVKIFRKRHDPWIVFQDII